MFEIKVLLFFLPFVYNKTINYTFDNIEGAVAGSRPATASASRPATAGTPMVFMVLDVRTVFRATI